jgi:hypothetical protein
MLAGRWLPIETAPKDGSTEILAYHTGLFMGAMVLRWYDGMWREKKDGSGLKTDPDYWQPLPPPPQTTTEEM